MVNIVIFDDNQKSATDLHEQVERLIPLNCDHHITEVVSLDALLEMLAAGQYIDLFISDIVMPEGQPSGIDVVRRLFPPNSGTQVIYVSGYLDQALEVYPTNHLYFLLKPVDDEKLAEALTLALSAVDRQRPRMIRIKIGHREQLIHPSTIVFLESNLRKVTVFCKNAQFETYAKLNDLMTQLPEGFVRCHRSYIVNLAYVMSLDMDIITLFDGTNIPVSRRRSKEVQHALLAHITGRSQS